MSIVANFSVPADAIALSWTMERVPEMRIEAERIATHSREWVLPFVWASGGDFDAFEAAVDEDPTAVGWSVVDAFDDTRLYEIRWVETVAELVDEIVDQHGTVLEASAAGGSWYFEIRFTEQSQVEGFGEHFDEKGVRFELQQLSRPEDPRQATYGLTEEQRETLVRAQEEGYYRIPREVSVAELADYFGISSNSVSQRLRRGCDSLIKQTLVFGSNDADADRDD